MQQGAQPLAWSERFLQALKGRYSFEMMSLEQNFGKESFFMFPLVLIQERTKENQG